MDQKLENILKELNPMHDFDNIKFYNHIKQPSSTEKIKAQRKNMQFFLTLVKPLARGSVIGGTIGAVAGLLSDYPPAKGFVYGAFMGASLDYHQYLCRGVYHYIKKQFSSSD